MFNAITSAEIWLQDTIDKPLGIEDLANQVGYSSSQVRRQCRHCFHVPPSAYRKERRLSAPLFYYAYTSQYSANGDTLWLS